MSTQPNQFDLNASAMFIQKFDPVLKDLTLNKCKQFADFKGKCTPKKVSPAGLSTVNRYKTNANLKMGASSMDYPTPTRVQSGRYSMRTANLVLTNSFDHETYEALITDGNARSSEQGGVVSNLGDEMKAIAKALGDRQAYFLGGDGSGALGKAASGGSTTSLVMQATADGTHAAAFGVSQIDTDVDYDVYRLGTGVIGSFVIPYDEEYRINRTTNTVDLTSIALAGAPADDDIVTFKDSAYEAPNGFDYLINGNKTGTWQGKTVTSKAEDQSSVLDLADSAVQPNTLEQALMKRQFREKSSMREAITWYTSPTQHQEFTSQFYGIVRLSGFDGKVDPRMDSRYGKKEIEEYPYLDPDRWYGIEENKIIYAEQLAPQTYRAKDGSIFDKLRGSAGYGKGVFATNYGCMYNFLMSEPGTAIVIKRAAISTGNTTIANYLV